MSLHDKSSDDPLRLGKDGKGFRLNSSKFSVDELLLIARAVNSGNTTVVLTGVANLRSDDLIRIDETGNGRVILEN